MAEILWSLFRLSECEFSVLNLLKNKIIITYCREKYSLGSFSSLSCTFTEIKKLKPIEINNPLVLDVSCIQFPLEVVSLEQFCMSLILGGDVAVNTQTVLHLLILRHF